MRTGGKQDRFLPALHLDVLRKAMPHAESEVLDPGGHVPMQERAGDFNRLAQDFIDRHD
jgi:pimeloyl-ACP methyl ester carboxylesterase